MRRLRRLNVAENRLASLPAKLGDAMMLTSLWRGRASCYTNPLHFLSSTYAAVVCHQNVNM